MFSFLSDGPVCRQISCGVTETNPRTHAIIRANLGRSAMYGGRIEGVGPRYCPSIEDKVVRFADKESHQIFLEPEGLDDDDRLSQRDFDVAAAGGAGGLCPVHPRA